MRYITLWEMKNTAKRVRMEEDSCIGPCPSCGSLVLKISRNNFRWTDRPLLTDEKEAEQKAAQRFKFVRDRLEKETLK